MNIFFNFFICFYKHLIFRYLYFLNYVFLTISIYNNVIGIYEKSYKYNPVQHPHSEARVFFATDMFF